MYNRHSARRGAPLLSITAAVLSSAVFAPAALAFNPQPDPPGRQTDVAHTTTATFTTIAGAPNPVTPGAPFTVSGTECDRVAAVAPTGTLAFTDAKTGVSLGAATLTPDPTYENCADASVTDTETLAKGSYRITALYQPGGSTPVPTSPKASYIETVTDPLGEVYVGSNAGEISQLGFGSTGLLSPLSPSTISGDLPFDTAVSPNGKYVYATSCGGNDLLQFKVLSNGTLQADSQPTVAGGACPEFLTVSPNGKSVYMTNTGSSGSAGADSVSQYTVLANGTLEAKTPATVPTGATPTGVQLTPNGKYAYVVNSGSSDVSEFSVEANGTLMPLSPATVATTGDYPIDVAISPDGESVYVTCYGGYISQYDIGTNGVLTPMSPASVSTGSDPGSYYLAIDQTGTGADQVTSVYAANAQNDTIAQFSANANGTLTPDTPATLSSPDPVGIAVDDATNTVYVTNSEEGTVSQFTVAPDGTLSPATPATIAVGAAPWGIAVRP